MHDSGKHQISELTFSLGKMKEGGFRGSFNCINILFSKITYLSITIWQWESLLKTGNKKKEVHYIIL